MQSGSIAWKHRGFRASVLGLSLLIGGWAFSQIRKPSTSAGKSPIEKAESLGGKFTLGEAQVISPEMLEAPPEPGVEEWPFPDEDERADPRITVQGQAGPVDKQEVPKK